MTDRCSESLSTVRMPVLNIFFRDPMSAWHLYIVRCVDASLYVGITTDVSARIAKHNLGKGGAYTRSHKPVTLVWREPAASESAARKREAELKRWSKEKKETFLRSHPL